MNVPNAVALAMIAHAHDAAPAECCGLLLGDFTQLTAALRARNIADDPTRRYLVNPHDHLAAIRQARAQGQQVVGAYHSHPGSTAVPSATDRASAFGDFVFVIVGLASDPPDLRAWMWRDGNFVTLPLVRVS